MPPNGATSCSTVSAADQILIDTGALLSALFPDQHRHRECAAALESARGPLVLSPFVLAELDYLIGKLAGVDAQLALLDEVSRGVYDLATFSSCEVGLARQIADTYRDLRIGLADASVVVLSNRLSDRDVLAVDERHFRVIAGDHPLRLLPADA